jgi:hypothetical protein
MSVPTFWRSVILYLLDFGNEINTGEMIRQLRMESTCFDRVALFGRHISRRLPFSVRFVRFLDENER